MLAVITGGSSGIGFHIAEEFASRGYDLVICASKVDELETAAAKLRQFGHKVQAVVADLSSYDDVEKLAASVKDPIDALVLNAGTAVYGNFVLENRLEDEMKLVHLNVESVVHLAKLLMPAMVSRKSGRVLITASVAAVAPGPLYATYAASKAFLLSFSEAIRSELLDSGVAVTCLMPGPTKTKIFKKTGMTGARINSLPQDDPVDVARDAFAALMRGDDKVVSHSWLAKIQAFGAGFVPQKFLAAVHKQMTKQT